MSATTPTTSTPDGPSSANVNPTSTASDPSTNSSATDRLVLEYLRARGHKAAEQALLETLDGVSLDDKGKQTDTSTISAEELLKRLNVFAQKSARPGENVFKDAASVLQELAAMGNNTNIQNLLASIGPIGAEEILSLDPNDKQEGFRELEAWVDGSLDMYRVSISHSSSSSVPDSYGSLSSDQCCFRFSVTFTSTLYSMGIRKLVRCNPSAPVMFGIDLNINILFTSTQVF